MKTSILSTIAFGVALLTPLITAAQGEVVKVETNIVTLNVAVTDKSGNYVKGLKKSDFSLTDNAMRQDIDTFSSEQAPISFGIVYDLHPSTEDHTSTVLAALDQFVKGLRSDDTYFVTVFNEKGSLTTEFVPSREQLDKFLAEKDPRAANSLYDAIFAASAKVRTSGNSKKVLFVLTDGSDHSSHHSLRELRRHLRSVNLPVYSLTFSNVNPSKYGYTDVYQGTPRRTLGRLDFSALDRGAIAEISKASGGQSFEASVRNRYYLAGLLGKVGDEVRNQYVLGFYPDELDGRWHSLKVTVAGQRSKKLKVSNRKGYQSPKRG